MATLNKGWAFGATETVTAAKLAALVDNATISNIISADISSNAITNVKINDVSGAKFTDLSSIPSGAGKIPVANHTYTDVTTDIYNTAWTDYSSVTSLTGFSSTTRKVLSYKKIGRLVFVLVDILGTSNSTSITLTLPYTNIPLTTWFAGSALTGGVNAASDGSVAISSNVCTLYPNMPHTVWSNGTSAWYGQFWYEVTS